MRAAARGKPKTRRKRGSSKSDRMTGKLFKLEALEKQALKEP